MQFRLLRPDPSHRAFGYCSCKQDANEPYWGQQFCEMERDGPTDLKWADGWNIPIGPNQNGPFLLISNRISGILGWMESAPVKVDYTSSWSVLLTRGLLPYISHIGMCRPIGSRFCAVLVWKRVYTLPILVWNRVWFSSVLSERMNVFIVSIPNEQERKKNTRIRNAFEEFFLFAHWIEEMMTWFFMIFA